MANKGLFSSVIGRLLPSAGSINHEGAIAYDLPPKQKLAQFVATGCLNATFYANEAAQLKTVLELVKQLEPEFIAKAAVYARREGHMKDMPALLLAALSVMDTDLLVRSFPHICDNGRMLRNFVQIMRSGAVGRKSLGTRPKKLVRSWLDTRSDEEVFRASVGNSPSVADIIKMVHPVPASSTRGALYGYLIGKEYGTEKLPGIVRKYELYKSDMSGEIPDVPFQMLTSLELGRREWTGIARNARWHMTRMNLNTFKRHGVFDEPGMAELIAERLRNPEAVRRARAFPYQLMVAYLSAEKGVPQAVRDALQDAMEVAIENVPVIEGKVYICPDVSGSMHWPVTGWRKGATSKVRCVDVAGLMTAAVLRKNPQAEVIPFESSVVRVRINTRDSVMTNAEKLASIGGGGTNCSAPLKLLNRKKAEGGTVILISDNQSWVDNMHQGATSLMRQWNAFKARNPEARMVCLDIQPYENAQAVEREDILKIGGFSDNIFSLVGQFAKRGLSAGHWVDRIESVEV